MTDPDTAVTTGVTTAVGQSTGSQQDTAIQAVTGRRGEQVVARPWVFGDRLWPRPQPVIVLDPAHSRDSRDYLAWLDRHRDPIPGPAPALGRRIVVRPTPGVKDQAGVGLDLLCALGKNPQTLHEDQLRGRAWLLAQAWLAAAEVTDLFVDQAHALPLERLVELLELSLALPASLWLIWGGPQDIGPISEVIRRAGFTDWAISPSDLREVLPGPGVPVPPAPEPGWPALPGVDFPTFRAACHRHLSGRDFARVDALYRGAFERVGDWMTTWSQDPAWYLERAEPPGPVFPYPPEIDPQDPFSYPAPIPRGGGRWPVLAYLREPLIAWLRDAQLGPARQAGEALTVLRATQASLLRHAIWLRWDATTLGADPAGRLPGTLTPSVAAALYAIAGTEQAAATALSLHLNHPPDQFLCWNCGDVLPDGSALYPPQTHRYHPRRLPVEQTDPRTGRLRRLDVTLEESSCSGIVFVPGHARQLVTAHLHARRAQGAGDDDPFFERPRVRSTTQRTVRPPSVQFLRERIIRTCARVNLAPLWLHRDPCKYGADVGLDPRGYGWLYERGLTLIQLDPTLGAPLVHRHRPPSRPRAGSSQVEALTVDLQAEPLAVDLSAFDVPGSDPPQGEAS